jgi:hypothetical protein
MIEYKTVGFIKEHDNYDFALPFQSYIGTSPMPLRVELIEFLKKGQLCFALMGVVDMIGFPEDTKYVHYSTLTDGNYHWPEYLINYLEEYPNFTLPQVFIDYYNENKDRKFNYTEKELMKMEDAFRKYAWKTN